jgi:predicted nucleic acid-binding protein
VSLVLDASVTLSWLLGDARPADRKYAAGALATLVDSRIAAHVPTTWALEVANVLAKSEARKVITEAQSGAFLEMLSALSLRADDATFETALSETLYLSRRYGISSYDASYLELALRLAAPLATLDQDLAKAARKAGVARFTAERQ